MTTLSAPASNPNLTSKRFTYKFDKCKFTGSMATEERFKENYDQLVYHDPALANVVRAEVDPSSLTVTLAEISYKDMFGNGYRTIYDDWTAGTYRLEPPTESKIA